MSLPRIRQGSEIFIRVKVYDNRVEPPVLYNPATNVKLTLTDPLGVIKVSSQSMTNVSTGIYKWPYQTAADDAVGVWTAFIKTTDGASVVYTEPADVCVMIV